MKILPFRPIEQTCPTWRKARGLIESRIPKPLQFQYENDKRDAVGTNTVMLDELWRIAPTECIEDMRSRIYVTVVYLNSAIKMDEVIDTFLDRPATTTLIETMNDFLRERDAQRVRLDLASFDELMRHGMGVCETSKPLNLVIQT